MTDRKATEKRSIAPVTFTVEFTATKVNENHNFFGLTGTVVKQSLPKDNPIKVVVLSMNGATYLKVDNANGLKFLTSGEAGTAKAEKAKLF